MHQLWTKWKKFECQFLIFEGGLVKSWLVIRRKENKAASKLDEICPQAHAFLSPCRILRTWNNWTKSNCCVRTTLYETFIDLSVQEDIWISETVRKSGFTTRVNFVIKETSFQNVQKWLYLKFSAGEALEIFSSILGRLYQKTFPFNSQGTKPITFQSAMKQSVLPGFPDTNRWQSFDRWLRK